MKEIVFLIFSLFSFNLHSADWIYVAGTNKIEMYFDSDSVRIKDDYVYSWVVTNLVVEEGLDWKSALAFRKFDCYLKRYQILSVNFYTERWGKGEVIESFGTQSEWDYSPPESVNGLMMDDVCSAAAEL